jgi:spermidine/putrescine transport system substrate-binding protein
MSRRLAPSLAALILTLSSTMGARAGGNLMIYTWTDYTAPALVAKFEKETGIKVSIDTFDTNETLLAKLKAGTTGYDIIIGSSDFIPIFIDAHLIQPIDASTWPDYKNIEARWRSPAWDKGNVYTVPFGWGVTSYVINTKFIKAPTDSLKVLFDPPPEARGKVGMFGAPTEVVSMAEVYLGLPRCETDIAAMKKVAALLEAQAPSVKVYGSDGVVDRAASGETWIQQTWNGDAARARAVNPDLRFIFPKEGAVAWMDNMAIPVGAPDPDNAKRFMQFMLKPENAALSTNFTHSTSPIAGVEPYLDDALRTAPEYKVPPDLKLTFSPPCSEQAIGLIDRVWTRLRR